MSFRRLVQFLTFLAIFTMAFRISTDSDTWWHLRAGAEIVDQKAVLVEDPFSLTRQHEPWRYPGWLAQVTLYVAYQAMGFAGLNLITALMVVVAFAFVWRFTEGPLLMRASLILLAAVASGIYWSARPQIMSFALAGVFIYLLEQGRSDDPPPAWIYFILMALWSNLHGGFAIGFLLIAAYFAGEILVELGSWLETPNPGTSRLPLLWPSTKKYGLILLLAIIGLAVNPHGPKMILYPLQTVSITVLREYIQEWQSPDFHQLAVQPFLWMVFLCFISFSVARKRPHPTDYLLVLGFAFMGFWAGRNIALFALAAVVPLSRAMAAGLPIKLGWLKSSKDLPEKAQKTINGFLAIILLLAASLKIAIPANNSKNESILRDVFPAGAVGYLADLQSPRPLFNNYNWGAYLIWTLYPDYLSFVDGRTDLFNDEILSQYLTAWRAEPGWQEVFERWDIQVVLIEPLAPLSLRLEEQGWERLYEDQQAVIFGKPGLH